jgi:Holliday junction resolvasome RuvABC ATP-dependent DNA helicase subunit
VFIDEVHLVPERLQESFLTMLEADDRELLLNGESGRRLARVDQAVFVFATTRPAGLDRAFRSRCIEIQLRRYTADEVTAMVRVRYPTLPIAIAEAVATISRLSPRQAFALAQEVIDETIISDDGAGSADMKACLKRVMDGRGILFVNGATRDDLRYLDVLDRARRPMGEAALQAALYDVDAARLQDDIEPYLLQMDYIGVSPKGRQITIRGVGLLEQVRETGLRVRSGAGSGAGAKGGGSVAGNGVRINENSEPIRVGRGTYVHE